MIPLCYAVVVDAVVVVMLCLLDVFWLLASKHKFQPEAVVVVVAVVDDDAANNIVMLWLAFNFLQLTSKRTSLFCCCFCCYVVFVGCFMTIGNKTQIPT